MSDNGSLKSNASKPKTPSAEGGKKVGFGRPTLIIPPPQMNQRGFTPHSASVRSNMTHTMTPGSIGPSHDMYGRKASMFVFDQLNGIKSFTMNTAKSGMGVGEKCSYWMYGHIRSLSKKWFTHFFLTFVLVLYTIGGALMFSTIEGSFEEEIKSKNMRKERYNLIRELRNLSLEMPHRTSDGEWEGEAARKFLVYEELVVAFHKNYTLLLSSEGKVWTLWNAVVYCATIYTTIVGMDASETHERDAVEKSAIDMAKIKALLTDEQVLSDTVARRRRKFTKKRSTSLTKRDPTPGRNLEIDRTTSDEDVAEPRPRTPDRKRPKRVRSLGKKDVNGNEELSVVNGVSRNHSSSSSRNESFQKLKVPPPPEDRKRSISDLAQEELLSLFNKTKKTLIRGRDRFKKHEKEQVKRSQSAPYKIPQEELIESFKQAQLLSVTPTPSRVRKYSDTELIVPPSTPPSIRTFRPEVENFVRQRKKQRQYSNKIIEILDPKTQNVLARQTIIKPPEFKLRYFFKVFIMFTPLQIYRHYKVYKKDMNHEIRRLRRMWNRCMFELFFIMMFCGIGGVLFKFTEGGFEHFYKCGVKRVKRDFIDLLWAKSHNLREEDWKSFARNRLRVFEEELHAAHEAGMTSYSGQRSWSFLNGVVYALTIVTTIGYGHLYPTTNTGRALTIVYSIIGIPLFLIALTDFGKLFTRGIKFLWSFVRRLYYTGSCRNVRKTAHVQEIFKGAQMMYEIATFRRPSMMVHDAQLAEEGVTGPDQKTEVPPPSLISGDDTPTTPNVSVFEIDDEFNLPITVALFILISYIFIGAVIYCMWEEWNFFASFYFVFISMSTIGFGDIVPKKPLCMFVTIVYLVFGLALMSMCINVVQEKLTDTFKQASAKLSATIGFEAEDDGSLNTAENVEIPGVHVPRSPGNSLTVPSAKTSPSGNTPTPQHSGANTPLRPPTPSKGGSALKPPTPPTPSRLTPSQSVLQKGANEKKSS